MNITMVLDGHRFNCMDCEVGIGEECLSKNREPMARFIHPNRRPHEDSEYNKMRLRLWLKDNARIFELPEPDIS